MWEALFAFHICIAHRLAKFLRCQIAQRAVWAHFVVIESPIFDGFAGIVQVQEPVLVQTLLAKLSVVKTCGGLQVDA